MKMKLNQLMLICGLGLCFSSYADISGQYNCLTGNMAEGKIIQANVTITKEGDHFLTRLEWNDTANKSDLDYGILNATSNPNIFKEEWNSKSKEANLLGMSFWSFQKQNILIDYLYINETQGTVHDGEMTCTVKN
jgi:hypothetical protein